MQKHPTEIDIRFDRRTPHEMIKDEMLHKYEENIYLLSRIFSTEPLSEDSSDSENDSLDSSFSENGKDVPMTYDGDTGRESKEKELDITQEMETDLMEHIPHYREVKENVNNLRDESKELEEYLKFAQTQLNSQKLIQNELLTGFEDHCADFEQLIHSIKMVNKDLPYEIDGFLSKAKELEIYPYKHPHLRIFEEKEIKNQRPFAPQQVIKIHKIV